jgi:hypothetical protein
MKLFRFAPRPADRVLVHPPARPTAVKDGFVGFSCERMILRSGAEARRVLIDGVARELKRRDGHRRR